MHPGQPLTPQTRRLFLALWPDDGIRGQVAAHASQWLWPPGCAPCAPADWHVTLHFIGDVASERVEEIADGAAVTFQPFELVLDQPVLWLHGLAVLLAPEVPLALRALHERLGDRLRGLGLPVDTRPYVPHITLARRAGAAIPPRVVLPVGWPARGVALVVSTGLQAPRYRVIRQYGRGPTLLTEKAG